MENKAEDNALNTNHGLQNNPSATEQEWHKPQPEKLSRPTYWPAFMALGITFLGLGLVTTLLVSGVGFILIVIALAGWIREIRHGD
ncbi:MAG: hypothetical protein ACM3SR_15930 [Ignavibacteriales bacterium]